MIDTHEYKLAVRQAKAIKNRKRKKKAKRTLIKHLLAALRKE